MSNNDEEIRKKGEVRIGFSNLNADDFRRIVVQLASKSRRDRRPRKCRRYDGKVAEILANIPSCPVWCFSVLGNPIGDAGTQHLHLLPDTIEALVLSHTGITAEGAREIAAFLTTNTSVTRMVMGGDSIGDEGAQYIAEMLCHNRTLQELSMYSCRLGSAAYCHLSAALKRNHTLQNLSLALGAFTEDDLRTLMNGLKCNRGLETLDLSFSNIKEVGVGILADGMEQNLSLKHIKLSELINDDDDYYIDLRRGTPFHRLAFWLKLNQLNRKPLMENGWDPFLWADSMIQAGEKNDIDSLYFFLRNKPEYLQFVLLG